MNPGFNGEQTYQSNGSDLILECGGGPISGVEIGGEKAQKQSKLCKFLQTKRKGMV